MRTHTIALVATALLFAFSATVRAELRHVEIKTLGMD
jgi:hypothetical protein